MRPASRAEAEETLDVIDAEVARLPARYRDAVVLCDLEGRPYAEAARRLRCPLGTLQSRLTRGRERLRSHLLRRGVAPMAATAILADSARAAVPGALAEVTIRAATAGAVSASSAALAGSVATGLVLSTARKVAGVFAFAAIVLGAGLVAREGLSDGPPDAPAGASAARDHQPPRQDQPQPPRADRSLALEVVDGADNTPVAGATVRVRGGRPRDSQGTTDEEGRYRIALPGLSHSPVEVVVAHPRFAPIEIDWATQEPVPDSYRVILERGVPIGGTVRDDRGRPVAGARVHLQIGARPPRGGRERYPDADDAVSAVSDGRGRWRSESLPASAGAGVRLELVTTHPDHVALEQAVTAEALRAFAAVAEMKAGRSLSGTVVSPTGRPVAGATVVIQSRSDRRQVQRVRTDRDGGFRTGPFIDPKWSEFTMVVQAEGFALSAQLLLVPEAIPPQSIRLSPRRPLHGRVVDAQKRPVAGAIVRSATEFGYAGLDWEAQTDADGRFAWFEAPASGTYMLDLTRPPFRQIVARMVSGGTEDLTLALHRPQHLHGTVTDAETGRPIERFEVALGRGPIRPGWEPEWNQGPPHPFIGGRFDMTGSDIDQDVPHSIRVEADGYEPAEFIGFPDSQEDVGLDFRLRRATPMAGIVRGPDGRPLAGVDLALVGGGYEAVITNGRLTNGSGHYRSARTRTGPDGRYSFRAQGHRVAVIAVHDVGFAIRSADELAASADLTLAPWARVEGILQIGARPAPAERVLARLITPAWWGVGNDIRTDASGRFVLERVAPGRITVLRRVETPGQGWMASNAVNLDVKPGETVRLQIGGTGRPVVGRLGVPAGVKLGQLAPGSGGRGSLKPILGEPPTPDDFLDFNSEQRAAWWEVVARTPEGRAHVEDRDRSYAVDLRPDGTFRIEDVPAGRYVLKLPFEGLSRGTREGRQAFAHAEVVVPQMTGGRSDEPLDIGVIPLEVFPFHEPRVGEPAPTIAGNLPDGRPLDFAAYRGKFVLLHFWSGRPEDAPVVPHLKATYDAFGRDPRFVMIGLITDETPGPVRRYAAHHGLPWEQRYIGSTYDPNPIEAAFGIWFPPAAFLIGPDGRILAGDLQGDGIRRAVARALE